MLEGSTPKIMFMKDNLQRCWNEVVFWHQKCMDQETKIEELEKRLSDATRCGTRDDFDHFIAHHWLPFQSMVFVSGLKFILSFNLYFRHQTNFPTFTHPLFPLFSLNNHKLTQ